MSVVPENDDVPSAGAHLGVTVGLAEFGALRDEIVSIKNTQSAFIGAGLTAVGVAFGFVLGSSGAKEILLGVPFFALILSLLRLSKTFRMHRLGEYIRTELWPYLQATTGYPNSCEAIHSERVWRISTVTLATAVDGVVPVLYAGLGAAGVWLSGATGLWLALGWIAVALTLAFPAAMAFVMTSPAEPSAPGHLQEPEK